MTSQATKANDSTATSNSSSDSRHAYLRRLAKFLSYAEPAIDILGLLSISVFFIQLLPKVVLGSEPATGGDMGSHFWPLYTLVHYALPHGALHTWNPGNLGGEPHLVHYFPLPFVAMAALSLFMPLGTAFNVGSLVALLFLPLCAYFCFRLAGWKFPAPLLASIFSLSFLYNESFAMWGGNTLSTMAGQYSHGYAFCFMLLGLGALMRELRLRIFPFWSALLFACVALSHAYILLGLPWIYLASFLFAPKSPSYKSFIICLSSGVFAILLAIWFLYPMVDNSPWTTAFFFKWISPDLLAEVFPPIFKPVLIALALVVPLFFIAPWYRKSRLRGLRQLGFWLLPSLAYTSYYFVFPVLGLVDVRAFPQVEVFVCLLSARFLAFCLRPFRIMALLSSVLLIFLGLSWVEDHIKNFPGWAEWNYSSWNTKPAYPGLMALSDKIRGDFSMPRVVYEHNDLNNKAGTERVFEMLPYFAKRATLESVYLQASILGPAAFLIQAEISKTPSCPFEQYECAPYDISKVEQHLKLMGVGSLIILTPELRAQADAAPFLEAKGEYGQWKLFEMREQPKLIELFSTAPLLSSDPYWQNKYTQRPPAGSPADAPRVPVETKKWKDLFYYWLKNYEVGVPFILQALNANDEEALAKSLATEQGKRTWSNDAQCTPEILVDFDTLHIKTNCPGRAHLLKFAYHSSWKADSADKIYLVSPGYMAIVPSKNEITLKFGQRLGWKVAAVLSLITLVTFVGMGVYFKSKRFL